MNRRVYLTCCGLAALGTTRAPAEGDPGSRPGRATATRRHMGVAWTIVAHAPEQARAAAAIAAAHDEIARLEKILSDYDPASELSRLSARAPTADPLPVSADLWRVLSRAVAVRDATGGAFDPTVGPLTTLWRQARRTGVLPSPAAMAAARAAVGPETLVLHPDRSAVELTRSAMRLDLGGIGMGDAIDRAMGILRQQGIESAMIDASGDIAVIGAPPGRPGWQVALAALGAVEGEPPHLVLADAAVTTSGDAFQAVTIDGVRYSHVVDPRTGLGVRGPSAVTVIARDATTADALATAANVLGPEDGMRLIVATPEVHAARFVWRSADGARQERRSPRWPGS